MSEISKDSSDSENSLSSEEIDATKQQLKESKRGAKQRNLTITIQKYIYDQNLDFLQKHFEEKQQQINQKPEDKDSSSSSESTDSETPFPNYKTFITRTEFESVRAEFQEIKDQVVNVKKELQNLCEESKKSVESNPKNVDFVNDLEKVSEFVNKLNYKNSKNCQIREIVFAMEELSKQAKVLKPAIDKTAEELVAIKWEKQEKEKEVKAIDLIQLLKERRKLDNTLKMLKVKERSYSEKFHRDPSNIRMQVKAAFTKVDIVQEEKKIQENLAIHDKLIVLENESSKINAEYQEATAIKKGLETELDQTTTKLKILTEQKTYLEHQVKILSAEVEDCKLKLENIDISKIYNPNFLPFG